MYLVLQLGEEHIQVCQDREEGAGTRLGSAASTSGTQAAPKMLHVCGAPVQDKDQSPLDQILDRGVVRAEPCLYSRTQHTLSHELHPQLG